MTEKCHVVKESIAPCELVNLLPFTHLLDKKGNLNYVNFTLFLYRKRKGSSYVAFFARLTLYPIALAYTGDEQFVEYLQKAGINWCCNILHQQAFRSSQ